MRLVSSIILWACILCMFDTVCREPVCVGSAVVVFLTS